MELHLHRSKSQDQYTCTYEVGQSRRYFMYKFRALKVEPVNKSEKHGKKAEIHKNKCTVASLWLPIHCMY